jgi:hypothetical protein
MYLLRGPHSACVIFALGVGATISRMGSGFSAVRPKEVRRLAQTRGTNM